jgi:hypothetical protein
VCLQINTIKYDANWNIMNIYENLQIIQSQFCTDMLLFIYIWSTSNIDWFISIQISWEWMQTNSYLVTFGYSQYLAQHSMNDPEGKKTTIRHYLIWSWLFSCLSSNSKWLLNRALEQYFKWPKMPLNLIWI